MAVNEAYRRQVARLDISVGYNPGVRGMVNELVTLDELLRAREDLIDEIVGKALALLDFGQIRRARHYEFATA